jgi:GTP-binding protein EngB required for normal cell division
MANLPKSEFVFRKHMTVGEADAENDQSFLEDCFVDIGDYEVLCNTSAPQCIVLGRTGAGKSALLEQVIRNQERVINIEPEQARKGSSAKGVTSAKGVRSCFLPLPAGSLYDSPGNSAARSARLSASGCSHR